MRNLIFLYCFILLATCGCGPKTGDPRQGGLFGWDEGQAVQRQRDLSGTLEQEKSRVQSARNQSSVLEQNKRTAAAELEHQRRRLADIEKELNGIRGRIQQIKVSTSAKQKEKQYIESRIKELQGKIVSARNNRISSVQQRKQEMNRLKSEIDQLLQLMSAL